MQKFFAIIFFLSLQYLVAAQQKDSALIKALIDDIAASQVKTGGEFYAGMFPTFRECGGAPHNYQPDNNIFFTAITAFGLRNMLPYLNEEQRQQATSIIEKIVAVYPKYQNPFGDPFYNFWPTGKPIMPHTYFFKWLKGVFGQGDDADDTVMILMTGKSSDSIIKVVKQRMLRVANLATENRKIKSTYKEYRNIPAHSTYLGLRMPPDFDFAVQCNLLYFMFDKKLLLVKQDSATIELLAAMVKNREYMTAPAYISPYYVTSPILLYHLTRLMAAFKIPALEMYKPQVAKDIHALLENKTNIMDQIILRTSLLRLGEPAPALDIKSIKEFEESNQEQFIFFQARAAFSYPSPFKQIFLHFSYINYYFYCPVYNKMLWLEYLVEKGSKSKN